ncbi:MAG: hypothetical protein ACI8PT_001514 [Gammaproteobacteria bacterium]|jgi:hypothetical protein
MLGSAACELRAANTKNTTEIVYIAIASGVLWWSEPNGAVSRPDDWCACGDAVAATEKGRTTNSTVRKSPDELKVSSKELETLRAMKDEDIAYRDISELDKKLFKEA